MIAVAAERSLEESWLGANTAEKGEKERERSEPPLNIDREREKEREKKKKAERPRKDRSKFVWKKTDAPLRMALHRETDGDPERQRNAG